MLRFFALLCMLPLFSSSQVLNPKVDWLSLEDFFNTETIRLNQIKEIKFTINNKVDGKIVEAANRFYTYTFDLSGLLLEAEQKVETNKQTIVMRNTFEYSKDNLLLQKTEQYRSYIQKFQFFYDKNKLIYKELKTIESPNPDTSYLRYYWHENSKNKSVSYLGNTRGKAFMTKIIENTDSTIKETIKYLHYKNPNEAIWRYKKGKLISILFTARDESRKMLYNEKLIEVLSYEKGLLKHKTALMYNNMGLENHLIQRDYDRKELNIIKVEYVFYEEE